MSKKMSYVLFGLLIIVCICIGDLWAYRMTISKTKQMQSDFEKRISKQVAVDVTKQIESKAVNIVNDVVNEKKESISANANCDTLGVDTVYQIENYNAKNGKKSTDYEILPEEFIGFTRKDADDYCKSYMHKMSIKEYLDGLQSIGVVSFSKERLVVKKIYDNSKIKFRYYLIAVDGEVVVYYGDKKTVYEYTGIETKKLSKEDRAKLKSGIEVKDEPQLYSILENYSS